MSGVADWLLHLDPTWVLLVVGLLVFAEDAFFLGFAIPGETAAVIAGVASALDHVSLPVAIVVVVVAAVLGDTVGYEVGKHFLGPKVLARPFLDRHRHRIEGAQRLIRRRGGLAVFIGRWTALLRALMPALAGASHMRYRTFVIWNGVGGIAWGVTFVMLGHVAGASYHQIEKRAGHWVAIGFGVVVVLGAIAWHLRSKARERAEERAADAAEELRGDVP
ncbi:DedA family protein [Nocardioides jiangxiensis]|uniref:DedA family protein n=1 Tax=Nocardioides jiangxiensis TaxID=3064524 RepID=A0ABT9AYQ5_9ACTN|nr:DedA family protein [Nocardioides sp. WY-20]MDO7867711.1 DedA family protein [Nocardioides sp. WY-20]